MMQVTLFSKAGCKLCDQSRADLEALQREIPHQLVMVEIDSQPELMDLYAQEVSIVEAGPYRLKSAFSRQELIVTLRAAQDRSQHLKSVDDASADRMFGVNPSWTRADGFSYWFSRHYMTVFNLFVLLYVGLPFLAPVLMLAGLTTPAGIIYRTYSLVCHQLSFRSFFLFGEQPFYPRAAAEVPQVLTFQQASGLSEGSEGNDLLAARDFVGNRQMGFKVALCERDVAIYGAIFLFGVLFVLSGKRLPALPWYLWILIGILPIAIDGFSQLFSQPPFDFIVYRESTPYLRLLTGALFGLTTAWFGYPMVEESMLETRKMYALKFSKTRRMTTSTEPTKLV